MYRTNDEKEEMDLTGIEDTLPKLLLRNYHKYGSKVGMREKKMGIWHSYSWTDYYEKVKHLSLALISMGLRHGERISILGENKPHAYWFQLAAQSAGAVVVGIFADCTPSEVEYYVKHSDSCFVVCQDQEQVDKVISIKKNLPELKKIIYWDPKGLWKYTDPFLISFNRMIEMGKEVATEHSDLFEESVKKTKDEDLAVFFYTSGTTGQPKAGKVTHKALIGMAKAFNEVNLFRENEEYLSFVPIAWLAEQLQGVACSLICGLRVNFPEKPETVQENIREIGPEVVFFAPRLWESLIRMVQVNIMDSSWLHRFFYHTALKIGYSMADVRMKGAKPDIFLSLIYRLAHMLVFRSLRDNLGLLKTRVGYTASASVSPEVIRFFHAIGINVKQLYGGSEIGVVTCHDNLVKPETCGRALPNVDIRISDEGEILVKTPNMFSGYHKEESKDAEKVKNGWYHTGDFGLLDKDGQLLVMDRMEDVLNLAGGKKFSPQYCEIRLRFSPYIKDALVVGRQDQSVLGVLINIDLNNVGHWAESNKIPYTTFVDLSQKPQVIELVRREITRTNEFLPDYCRIRRFINLHKEFDPDEAEMTRTRKLRRTFVEKRFKDMIDAIFSDKEALEVISQITYQDGRTGNIKYVVKVNKV